MSLGINAAIARASRDVAFDLTNLGSAEHQLGNREDAAHLLRQAEVMLGNLPAELARCSTNLAVVLSELDRVDEAIEAAQRACAAAEEARVLAGNPETREALFALHQSPFAFLLDLLGERDGDGDADRVFGVLEAALARTLADLLGERPIRSSLRLGGPVVLLQEERRLLRDLLDASSDPGDETLHSLRDQLEECRHRLRRAVPQFGQLAAPRMATVAEAKRVLAPDTLLLSFGDGTESKHLWAARGDRAMHLPLAASPGEVVTLVDEATAAYRRGERGSAAEQDVQRELGRILLGGLTDELKAGVRHVVVVPSGRLFHLPFELLPWGDGLLVDVATVSYAPSVSVLRHGIRSQGSADRPFVGYAPAAADAPLPDARNEVRQVAAILGGALDDVHLSATKETVAQTISGARQVYFATHGVLDDEQPMQSGLLCTPTGQSGEDPVLRGDEILDLRLDADVVVCSACDSGLGKLRAGEGMVGLSRALFFAGARCLVLSLWPVPGIPTRRLVTRFAELMRDGLAPAEALREAKQQLRASRPEVFGTPWTWAGFVVLGDARHGWIDRTWRS